MYLKALEIQGFKSFPDKTVLNFGEDITAIVGPNGSGKSNISDAIRWVMGEQSVKGLRGAKMEDVIFGGTEKRAQVGFAQVTLVLDNTEHIFPTMEESEVSVTRRYYRSGESEYYINRQSVRLKDVTELFLDTGMGREGYSIIGQGKIDEILSAKSGERREIFEEAAGISKFRHRKEEAERKLERTEENLVRINDKIAELELQVDPLREQAEKAKKYLVLRDELRLLEISVWLENLDTLKAGARKLEADLRAAEAERDQARADLDALYAEGEQYSEKMRQKDMEAEAVRAEAAALEGQVKEKESAAAVLESAVAHNQENIERAQAELAEADSRAGGLAKQAEDQEARVAEIDRQMEALNGELDALLERAQAMAERAGGAQSEAEQLRGREAMAVAAAADRRAEKAAAEAERAQILERREAAERDRAAGEEQLQSARQEAKDNRRALEDARDEAQAAANIIAGHELRMEERKKKADEAAARRMQLTVDAQTLENRRRLLTEMEKEYEGFSKAVKLICQAQSGLRGIHGPVASLVKTDGKYSLAIEIALGAGLQNIVVDREEDAKAAIGYLKQRDGGRATFLPLTAIRGDELREKGVENEFGFVGLASRLVSFDPRYQNIVYNLLGRTVVAEDLDCGIAMARKYKNAFRIVTLDGQVINRGGSMTGGSTSRSAGVLSRAAELERLTARAEALREQLASARKAEEDAARELSAAQYELETAEAQRRQAEDEVLRLEGAKSHFDILLGSLEENLENLTGELASLAGRLADNEQRAAAAQEEIERQESAAADLRARAEAALSGQSELLEQSGALTEEISAKKSALAALAAEREATARSAADLRALCADLSGDRAQKERTVETYRQNIADAQAQIEALKRELEALAGAGRGLPAPPRRHQRGKERPGGGADRQEPGRPGDERAPAGPGAGRGQAGPEAGHLRHGGKADPGPAVGALRALPLRRPGPADRAGERAQGQPADRGAEAGHRRPGHPQHRRHRGVRPGEHPLHLPDGPAQRRGEGQGRAGADHRRDHRRDDKDLRRAVQAALRELPDHLPGALRRRRRQTGAGGRGGHPGLRHRDQGPAPGQDPQDHLPALRRREGLRGHRPVLRHPESPPHALLRHGRDRGGAGRRQRHPLRPLYAAADGKDAVHRHHPPPGHHGGGRRPLRRHHAGAGREQDPDHQPERHGEGTEDQVEQGGFRRRPADGRSRPITCRRAVECEH